jgi:hypothetical protein
MPLQRTTRFGCSLLFNVGFVFALAQNANAGLVGDESWREVSADGRFVLVMISPDPTEVNWLARWPSQQSEVLEIREKYETSGLYRNDGSAEPLWTIPYHLPVYEVYVSPDGQQVLIVQEDWGHTISNIPGGGSLFFYDKDGEIASYQDHELTWCWLLKGLANNLMGRSFAECDHAHYDSEALTYTIKTSQSEEFVFDVTTGKIIRRWSLWPFYLGVPLLGVPAALFGYYRSHRRRSHVEPAKRRRWGQFSLRGMLIFVTAVCVLLWGMSFNGILVIVCLTIAVLGGGVAWVFSKTRRAWLIGAILAMYGGLLGIVVWARLCDYVFLWFYEPVSIGTLATLELIGVVAGGLVAGWLERSQQVTQSKRANATAPSTDRLL